MIKMEEKNRIRMASIGIVIIIVISIIALGYVFNQKKIVDNKKNYRLSILFINSTECHIFIKNAHIEYKTSQVYVSILSPNGQIVALDYINIDPNRGKLDNFSLKSVPISLIDGPTGVWNENSSVKEIYFWDTLDDEKVGDGDHLGILRKADNGNNIDGYRLDLSDKSKRILGSIILLEE